MAIAAVTALAAALRLTSLGGKSLWLDEAFSIALARAPWPVFVRQLQTKEANMGLYYVLLRLWLPLGLSESTVRLLSAIVGIATIPVVYAVGTRLLGRRAGLIAAIVLALDPFHLALSQDARSYPLAIFLAACSVWTFTHVVGEPAESPAGAGANDGGRPTRGAGVVWAWRIAYVIASAAAVYAHLYASFVVLAEWASLAGRSGRRTTWRAVVGPGVGVILLVSPMIAFVLSGHHGNIDWIAGEIPYAAAHLFDNLRTPFGIAAALYGILLAAFLCAIWWAGYRQRDTRSAWPYLLIMLWLITPVVIPIVVSAIVKPMFEVRYAAVALPAVALVAGAFTQRLSTHRRMIAMIAVLALVEGSGDWAYFAYAQKEDWRDATGWVLAKAAPGDVALFYAPYVRRPYDYYLSRLQPPAAAPRVLYPSAAYVAFGSADSTTLSLTGALTRARQSAPRAWLIVSHARADSGCQEALDASLRAGYRTEESYHFRAIDVRLYSARGVGSDAADDRSVARSDSAAVARRCPQA